LQNADGHGIKDLLLGLYSSFRSHFGGVKVSVEISTCHLNVVVTFDGLSIGCFEFSYEDTSWLFLNSIEELLEHRVPFAVPTKPCSQPPPLGFHVFED
jgi:hypothetical protein